MDEYGEMTNVEMTNAQNNQQPKKNQGFGKGLLIGLLVSVLVLLLVGGVGVGAFFAVKQTFFKQPQITSASLAMKLEDASDLTTAEMTYQGVIHYDDGGIPFITQKKYSMIYQATMEAGIDLSKVQIDVTDDKVTVKLPEVTVDDPVVDPDSIDFYDDSFAFFDWETKEDAVDAIKEARRDCKNKADIEIV